MLCEVDLEPFASRIGSVPGGDPHELGADALAAAIRPDARVEQEGVVAAVPGDVDEADQRRAGIAGDHPPEAVRPDALLPAGLRVRQRDDLGVGGVSAPAEPDVGERAVLRHDGRILRTAPERLRRGGAACGRARTCRCAARARAA